MREREKGMHDPDCTFCQIARGSDVLADDCLMHRGGTINRAIEAHLDSKHSSTWGRMYYTTQSDSRAECIAFIRNLVEDVNERVSRG